MSPCHVRFVAGMETQVIWELLIVAALILLNGFFAMAEMAVVSARRGRLQHMVERGSKGARAALSMTEDPTKLLSTVQIGITLIGVLAGAFSGATIAEKLERALLEIPELATRAETLSIAIVVICISYLSLIVGELVPKRIALANAEGIASNIARPMNLLSRVTSPVVWFLRISTETVLRLMGARKESETPVTEEEVRMLVAEGTEAGAIHQSERTMIEGVLRLEDRSIRTIMTPRTQVDWLDVDASPEDIRARVVASGHSRFLVCRGKIEDFIGVIHANVVLDRMLQNRPLNLEEGLELPLTVPETTPILGVIEQFRSAKVPIAVVIDEYGTLEGLVTPMDVLGAIAGTLLHTEDEAGVTEREDGSLLVDAALAIDELGRVIGRSELVATADYSTVAGFLLWHFGHMPNVAEHIVIDGFRFEVVDTDGRRIDKVLVSKAN